MEKENGYRDSMIERKGEAGHRKKDMVTENRVTGRAANRKERERERAERDTEEVTRDRKERKRENKYRGVERRDTGNYSNSKIPRLVEGSRGRVGFYRLFGRIMGILGTANT